MKKKNQKFMSILMFILILSSTILNPIGILAESDNVDQSELSELSDEEVIVIEDDIYTEEVQEELESDKDEDELKQEELEPVKNKGDLSEKKEIDFNDNNQKEMEELSNEKKIDEKEAQINEGTVDEIDGKSNEEENYSLDQFNKNIAKKPVDNITLTPNKEPMSRGGIGKVDISWSITDGSYAPGDLIKIQLPEDLSPPSKSLGDEYLQCSVVGNELFCVFTDAVDGAQGVSGELWYETMYLPTETSDSETPEETEKDFEFSSEGDIFSNSTTVILPIVGTGAPGQHQTHHNVAKWAMDVIPQPGDDGSKILKWQAEVNGGLNTNLGETVFTDTIGVGHEIIPESIDVSVLDSPEGPTGTNIIPADYDGPEPTIEISDDKRSFTVTYADNTLSGYRSTIFYNTKVTNENVGKWVNEGNVDNDEYNSGSSAEYNNTASGGEDRAENPNPSTVKFLKVEEDINGPGIAGVEFNIYTSDGEFVAKTLYPTDNNGNATVWTESNGNKLEPGTYYATEILGDANSDYEVDESLRHYFVITENEGTVLTIINEKKDNVKTSVKVNKKWENDTESDRPASIEVQLYQNDESYGGKKTLTESAGWTHTYNGLPKYDENGDLYKYTVGEVDVPEGYTSKVNGTTITNTLTPKTTEVSVKKVWVGEKQEKVTINLLADGKQVDTVDLSEDNDWTHTFIDLLEINETTEEAIVYTVEEVEVDGYTTEITGDASEGFTVTNTEIPEPATTEVSVEKVWVGEKQEKVTINLLADGKQVDTVDLSEDNDWTHTFTDLLEINETTEEAIVYTVEEVKVEGYTTEITGEATEGFTVTNTEIEEPVIPEPATTEVSVEKVWVGEKQEKVTINLLADGKQVGTVDLSEDNDWTHTFTDLLEINETTQEAIVYTVEEVAVEGYTTEITGEATEGFTVTNTEIEEPVIPEPATTEVSVEKVWVGEKQEKVTINLLADGKQVGTVDLSEDNDWTHTFTDLLEINETTQEAIVYTVEEVAVEGYTTEITGDAKDGFTITNTEIIPEDPNDEEPTSPTSPTPKDPGNELPKTATNNYNLLLVGALLMLLGLTSSMVMFRKKTVQEK